MNFSYQQTQQTPFRAVTPNTPLSHPHSRVYSTPPKIVQPIVQLPPPVVSYENTQNHIIREEGGQVLYYPIYPVYEVVYEPVSMASSLSPSRVLR